MSKGKLLSVCVIWVLILAIGVGLWKLVFVPRKEAQEAQELEENQALVEQQAKKRLRVTSSSSRYKYDVRFHLDLFSGYALIRSNVFKDELARKGIRLQLEDDGADYLARIKALKSGDAHMAVFTIDALIKVCAELGELPATIVAIVDETTGADAIVAYKSTYPNVDALDGSDTRFVLTPDSPSETLARVVMSRFGLENLADQPFIEVADASQVYRRYKRAKPADRQTYVLWEPYVSQILKNPETHVVFDSSQFPSTIVDVIVAARDFLAKNPDVVKDFVEGYFRTAYQHRERDAMVRLVMEDAKSSGAPLNEQEAGKIADGILWKNTQENLAHMGVLPDQPLPHIEDVIANITDVLESTKGIAADPTGGNANYLYYNKVFEELRDFHPGVDREEIRDLKLPPLTDEQWTQLAPVGTARVQPLVFARGTDRLTERSRAVLDELSSKLKMTRLYVVIQGNASLRGDLEQNKILAERRAKAAEQYLVNNQGVDGDRIRAVGVEPSGATSVSFVLGQLPY